MVSSDSAQKVFRGKYFVRECFRTPGYLESDRKLLQMVDPYTFASVLPGDVVCTFYIPVPPLSCSMLFQTIF